MKPMIKTAMKLVNNQTNKGILSDGLKAAHAIALVAKSENIENSQDQTMAADYIAKDTLTTGQKDLLIAAKGYAELFHTMNKQHIEMIEKSKNLTKQSKDYAGQVGEALARIDRVLIKDFDKKVSMLERFVMVTKEMVELEKSGALQKISNSFK